MLRTTRGRQSLPWKPAAFGVGLLGGLGVGYYWTHREPVPITGRMRFLNLTRQQELRLGRTAFQQVESSSRKAIVQDNKKIIEETLFRLSRSSGIPGFEDTKWRVLVINNPTPNAFVLPGGYCVVFTGIFKVAKNVDGLATVLSHEAAHVLARHGAERVSKSYVLLPIALLLSSFFGVPLSLVNSMSALLLELPNSRLQESEADEIGAVLMARACIYDTHEAVKFWNRFGKLAREQPVEFLSTHPNNKTREMALEAMMGKIDEERRARCKNMH